MQPIPSMTEPEIEPGAQPKTSEQAPTQAVGFARRHPVMVVLGAAGLGLFGGIEMAGGVLIGAGIYAVLRMRDQVRTKVAEPEKDERGILDRATPEIRSRAKAIVQAARGKLAPTV